jgi:hypothetical protein
MTRRRRRLLYTEDRVRALFARCLADLEAQHSRHLTDMSNLRHELDQVRAEYELLRSAVLKRERAEADLELLRRDRERAEGRAVWLH